MIIFNCLCVYAVGWTTTEVVSTESTDYLYWPFLGVGPDGTVHVVWMDQTDYAGAGPYPDRDIFYKRREPGGGWTTTEVIQTETTNQSWNNPAVAVGPDGTAHIVWQDESDYGGSGPDEDIFYKSYVPGTGWTGVEVVSTESTNTNSDYLGPSLAVGLDGTVHIIWRDNADYGDSSSSWNIFYKKLVPGNGWTTTEVVPTENTFWGGHPVIDVESDGTVHIAWWGLYDYLGSGSDDDVFYTRFEPGMGWTSVEVVSTESTGNSRNPSLGVGPDGTVHIAWEDETDYAGAGNDWDLFYKRFEPGSGWTTTEVISMEEILRSRNFLDVGPDGAVHIVWYESTEYGDSGTDLDILYNKFISGTGWTGVEVVSTESTSSSSNPSLCVGSDGTIHVVWIDYTTFGDVGNVPNVVYKKFSLTDLPPVASFISIPIDPEVNEEVTFDASDSNDPDGTIVNYEWDFGDGNTAIGIIVTHSYTQKGSYSVSLTVTDNDELIGTDTKTFTDVIPEFSTLIFLSTFIMATVIVIVIFSKKIKIKL